MSAFLDSLLKALIALKPGTLVFAIGIALFLAMVSALVYDKTRGRVGDARTLLISLVLIANVVSMVLAAGYVTQTLRSDRTTDGDFNGIVFRGTSPRPVTGPFNPPWEHEGDAPTRPGAPAGAR